MARLALRCSVTWRSGADSALSGTPVFFINGRLVSPALSRWRREFA
jgi:hypothetical protein